MKWGFAAALTLATLVAAVTSVEVDRLVSRRSLQKRFLDADGNYNISLYHVNDVHAHLDQFRSTGADCTDPNVGCYGGYARIKEVVETTRPVHNSSLFLNAGDEFQGTLFYSFYGGEKIAETLNQLGFDAITLGNHEFDGGDDELAAFLQNLTFPAISSNIHTNNTALNASLIPYIIFPEHNLAVVAVTTETTPDISSPGPGTIFDDPVTSIQRTVDEIKSTTNVTRIIALTHIGYDKDIEMAQNTRGIHLIIGGHSHTPLGNFTGARGPYPTIEENLDGDEVFVVTAYRWGEYLGYIDVAYDPDGKIVAYTGAPIHLTNTTAQDADLQAQITSWRGPFEAFAAEVLGLTEVVLDQESCQQEECTLGDFLADAMLQYRIPQSPNVAAAICNAGGIRATIDVGNITRGEVLTSFPFGNAVVELTFTGEELWQAFEGIVSGVSEFDGNEVTSFVQVSGIRFEYNPDNANGTKLISLQLGHDNLQPVVFEQEYQIVTLDFLAGGGDSFWPARDNYVTLNTQDEVVISYIASQSPVNIQLDGRISTTTKTVQEIGANSTSGNSTTAGNGTSTLTPPATTEVDSAANVLRGGFAVVVALAGVAAGLWL